MRSDKPPRPRTPCQQLHQEVLDVIEAMMRKDPDPGSREGAIFELLSSAVERYEKATLPPPFGDAKPERYRIEFDGFVGTVIGSYRRLDGEEGVVMQQDGSKVVHVYRRKWLIPVG